MTLAKINALRDLNYGQLVNVARQHGLLVKRTPSEQQAREWSPDRLRLRIVDSICDEELAAPKTETERERRERMRRETSLEIEIESTTEGL